MSASPVPPARSGGPAPGDPPSLVRGLGALDGTLLTIGAIVGTGIFLTAGGIAKEVGSPAQAMLVWLAAGLLSLCGALTYGELGTMFPRAGGIYHYLREAWGPVSGYLYAWTCMLVIMAGGIAAIASGFGEYLGTFLPALASDRVLWSVPIGSARWTVHGSQGSAAFAILALTAVNHFGLKEGAAVQNVLTALKVAAIGALLGFGFATTSAALPAASAPLAAPASVTGAFLTAMVAALWTYDGWYALTASAGEMRRPARDLPLAITLGVGLVIVLYLLLNLVYLRALPMDVLAGTTRVAEAAAAELFGPAGARWVSAAVVLSAFGCLSATILYSSRSYHPVAADGLFPRAIAAIHPRWRTPVPALWVQSAWAVALALTGSYTQLFTYTTFGGVLFHVLAGLAVFRLRAKRPHAERPYRAWGYPVVPALFVLGLVLLVVNTLQSSPRESMLGLLAIAIGLPGYFWWKRRPAAQRASTTR